MERSCALRSVNTDACKSQRARNRQGTPQAGSCPKAEDGSGNSGMRFLDRNEDRIYARLALQWNGTKEKVLRIGMGREHGRDRCLVTLTRSHALGGRNGPLYIARFFEK